MIVLSTTSTANHNKFLFMRFILSAHFRTLHVAIVQLQGG